MKQKVTKVVLFLLFLIPLAPFSFFASEPQLIVADRRYTSALIHDGVTAVIIDPGWRYKRRDDAELWLKHLRHKHLELAAIILSSNQSSRAAATKTLLEQFPAAEIVLLKDQDFPFAFDYCQKKHWGKLELQVEQLANRCTATLNWDHTPVALFHYSPGAIQLLSSSQLSVGNKVYDGQQLGMLTLTKDTDSQMNTALKIEATKTKATLWRAPLDSSITPD